MLLGIVTTHSIHDDPCFGDVIGSHDLVVAHVEKQRDARVRAGGGVTYRRDQWRFAHDGRIGGIALIRSRIAPRRALEIGSDSDGESLFAFLLTYIDATDGNVDAALSRAATEIACAGIRGIFSFVLSGSESLYAYRNGAPMALLVRDDAIIVSSDALTSEPWRRLENGAIVRIDRGAAVTWRFVTGTLEAEVSGPELPFTD